ncbi:MAG: type II restriction endonuclease [Phycisphaerales bacterium]
MQDSIALRDSLCRIFKLKLPSVQAICDEAIAESLGGNHANSRWIKENFSVLVVQIEKAAYRKYLFYQAQCVSFAFDEVLKPLLPDNASKNDFFQLLDDHFVALDGLFLSVQQGRKSRAGGTFERILQTLLTKLGYPYTSQPKAIDGKPDFILPSVEHYRANPVDCLIFTAKRTLRERWRQITTEGMRGSQFFLATIDPKIKIRDLSEMLDSRIILVVPSQIKMDKYGEYQNVISFEKFFEHYLDQAMRRWISNGIVSEKEEFDA